MPRKHASAAPDRALSAVTLRICDPGGLMPPVDPEVAPFLVAGHPFCLLAWTAEEWECLSGEQRPDDACRGSKGNWFRFAPTDDRQGS
jgi:hypothetical protein